MAWVFVLEDEPDINRLIRDALENHGFSTRGFFRADQLLFAMQRRLPDVIVLDLNLPDADGIEVAKQIKSSDRTKHIPIVMITARTQEDDTLRGFDAGADDYIKKPFSPREMVARVKRFARPSQQGEAGSVLRIGPITLVPEAMRVLMDGHELELSPGEFSVLHHLIKHAGVPVRRSVLLSQMGSSASPRIIDVYIRNLRAKLGPCARMIKSVRGFGYKIVEEECETR